MRWGYRLVHARLQKLGWAVNLKRVRRLWRELGLRRTIRRRPQNKLGPKLGTSANSCASRPARYKNDVANDKAIGDKLGVRGTPSFIINGKAVVGPQPFVVFKRVIDEALKK